MVDFDKVSRSQLENSLGTLFEKTQVNGISFGMSIPDNLRPEIKESLLSRTTTSWFDDRTGKVCLYLPNLMDKDLGFLHSSILFSAVQRYGLKNLFIDPDAVKVFSRALNRDFGSLAEVEKFIASNRLSGEDQLSVAKAVAFYLELEHFTPGAKRSVIGAFTSHMKLRAADGRRVGDYSLDDASIKNALMRYIDAGENTVLSLGHADTFIGDALGFNSEAPEFCIDARTLVERLKLSGFSEQLILDTPWASFFNNPIAVVKDTLGSVEGRYIIVMDLPFSDGYGEKLFCFKVSSPGNHEAYRQQKGFDAGKGYHRVVPFSFSYAKLAHVLSSEKENWLYMRPTKYGSTQFELVNRLEDRIIKNGTLSAPGVQSSGLRAEFLRIAKIAPFFENPKTREEKKKNFEALMKELDRMDAATLGTASQKAANTVSDRDQKMRTRFTENDLGKIACAKLNKAGIHTVEDLVNVGFDKIFEITDSSRAVNKVAGFLYSKGIVCVPKEQVQSVSTAPAPGDEGQHFVDCLKVFYTKDQPVYLPQRLDGSVFLGGDTLHLIAAKALEKRTALPVWLTAGELGAYGCEVGKALPVPVFHPDEPGLMENVYNISETTFPKVHKEEYGLLKDAFAERVMSGAESVAVKRLLWDLNGEALQGETISGVVDYFNKNGVSSLKASFLSGGLPLSEVVGENTVKQMERKGKALKMYNSLKRINTSVNKSKRR